MTFAPRLRLVGRAPELRQLDSEMRRAAGGTSRCVLLMSDAGLGKTRLAQELLDRHARSAICLSARAHPFSGTAPFGLWAEALESRLRTLDADAITAVCGGFLDDLASILRSVAAVKRAVPEHEVPRLRLIEGLSIVLRNLSSMDPVVVFLDDLHLADPSSLETLDYFARSLHDCRLLLLLAARPAELDEHRMATELVLRLEQDGFLRRLSLGALDREQTAELARSVLNGALPSDALVDWLVQRSGGYPLFALGLLRALIEEGADLSAPQLRQLPESLGQRVRSRLTTLDDESGHALEILAVLGQRVDLDEFVQICRLPLERIAETLRRLVQQRLVSEQNAGRQLTYEVAHPLIQEVVFGAIGGARRRHLHHLVARGLVAANRFAAAAPHFARSAEIGDSEAIEALTHAVRQAQEQEAYREAGAILTALLELLPPADPRWLDVLDFIAWQSDRVIDFKVDEDAEIIPRALRQIEGVLRGSIDPVRQGRVQYCLSAYLAYDRAELNLSLEAAARSVDFFSLAGRDEERRAAETWLVWVRGLSGDLATQERSAKAALLEAEAAGDHRASALALTCLGFALYPQGKFEEAEHVIRLDIAQARAQGNLHRLVTGLAVLAQSLANEGRLEEAREVLREGKSGNAFYQDTLRPDMSVRIHWMAGEFELAVEEALDAAAWCRGTLGPRRAWSLAVAAMALAELGRTAEAAKHLATAYAAYGGHLWYTASPHCEWAEGVLAALQGDLGHAKAKLGEAIAAFHRMGALCLTAFALADLAETSARAGDADASTNAAQTLGNISHQLRRPLYDALVNYANGWAKLSSGDHDSSIHQARAAVEALRGSGFAAFEGRALYLLGCVLAEGQRAESAKALNEAVSVFDRNGAVVRREQALRTISRLGHPGRRVLKSRVGPHGLTAREREVATLAAQGKTARDIGRLLFIGERTVETHLANVYAKLGIESKLELVRQGPKLGI